MAAENRSAKERKDAAKKRSTKAVETAAGKSGTVKRYFRDVEQTTINKARSKARDASMGKPNVLSAPARFDMLKPPNVHPFDWIQLYDADEEKWPEIVIFAETAVKYGELDEYHGPVK